MGRMPQKSKTGIANIVDEFFKSTVMFYASELLRWKLYIDVRIVSTPNVKLNAIALELSINFDRRCCFFEVVFMGFYIIIKESVYIFACTSDIVLLDVNMWIFIIERDLEDTYNLVLMFIKCLYDIGDFATS